MPDAKQTMDEINGVIEYLVGAGLADEQYFAFLRTVARNTVEVSFSGAEEVAIALRDRDYGEIYRRLRTERAYNLMMLDGALIQMMYLFAEDEAQCHRLAFFPAPHMRDYQSEPDMYERDEMYADVVAQNVVRFPVRFDYDARAERVRYDHPLSHLTLGQYPNCRIPVSAPLTPGRFVDFLLRSFYHTDRKQYADSLPARGDAFVETIRPDEQAKLHVVTPR